MFFTAFVLRGFRLFKLWLVISLLITIPCSKSTRAKFRSVGELTELILFLFSRVNLELFLYNTDTQQRLKIKPGLL